MDKDIGMSPFRWNAGGDKVTGKWRPRWRQGERDTGDLEGQGGATALRGHGGNSGWAGHGEAGATKDQSGARRKEEPKSEE